ncbi:hypothetical protein VSU19_09430 [Verrucomicrobiales bacterium BCK34]|nr:hypothetical protein [Verrucomicrobiales bacterium BCK34]
MFAIVRFLYVLVLPVAGCVVLASKGSHLGVGWALLIVVGIFIYHYLQAALIVTERAVKAGVKNLFLGVFPIVLVGVSASFAWQDWIVEQMFLEAGAFSLGVAFIAVGKGFREGRKAPWGAIVIVFLLPALTLVYLAGRTVFRAKEFSLQWDGALILAVAMVVAVVDTVRRLHPYVLGNDQLEEPLKQGWQIIFAGVWMLALFVGLPLILKYPGS